jgi:hypothetical protein
MVGSGAIKRKQINAELPTLLHTEFLVTRSNLTSLPSHLTHAVTPSWSEQSLMVELATPPARELLPHHTKPNQTAHSFRNLPPTCIPHTLAATHSKYKPPPPLRHHVATSEAQAHRRCRSARQEFSPPPERLQDRGCCQGAHCSLQAESSSQYPPLSVEHDSQASISNPPQDLTDLTVPELAVSMYKQYTYEPVINGEEIMRKSLASQTELQARIKELEETNRALLVLSSVVIASQQTAKTEIIKLQHRNSFLEAHTAAVRENCDAKIGVLEEKNKGLTKEKNDKIILLKKNYRGLARARHAVGSRAKSEWNKQATLISELQEEKSTLSKEISELTTNAQLHDVITASNENDKVEDKLEEQVRVLPEELKQAKENIAASKASPSPAPLLTPAPSVQSGSFSPLSPATLSTPAPSSRFGSVSSPFPHSTGQQWGHPSPPSSTGQGWSVSTGASTAAGHRPLFDKPGAAEERDYQLLLRSVHNEVPASEPTPAPATATRKAITMAHALGGYTVTKEVSDNKASEQLHASAPAPPSVKMEQQDQMSDDDDDDTPDQSSVNQSAGHRATNTPALQSRPAASEVPTVPAYGGKHASDGKSMDDDEDMNSQRFEGSDDPDSEGEGQGDLMDEDDEDDYMSDGEPAFAPTRPIPGTGKAFDGKAFDTIIGKSGVPSGPKKDRHAAGGSNRRTRANGAIQKRAGSNNATPRHHAHNPPSQNSTRRSNGTGTPGAHQRESNRSANYGNASSRGNNQAHRGGRRQATQPQTSKRRDEGIAKHGEQAPEGSALAQRQAASFQNRTRDARGGPGLPTGNTYANDRVQANQGRRHTDEQKRNALGGR